MFSTLLSIYFQGYKRFHKMYKVRKMKCTHQEYMLSSTLCIYFCIIVKKSWSDWNAVRPKLARKGVLLQLQRGKSFSSRRFWNMSEPYIESWRNRKGNSVKRKMSIWRPIAATLTVDQTQEINHHVKLREFPRGF